MARHSRLIWLRAALFAALVMALAAWLAGWVSIPAPAIDRATLRGWIDAAGALGPALIVVLMTLAIVASPIPSAPIALAAGAAYGHVWGTLLVLTGAEAGAMAAFGIARYLGRAPLERWLGQRLDAGLLGSQNTLTLLVFGSRLLPFVSFDMISYAAGLSALRFWRFALATLAGIVPASYLLAHLGSVAMSGDARTAGWTAAALGVFTLLSVGGASLVARRRARKAGRPDRPPG